MIDTAEYTITKGNNMSKRITRTIISSAAIACFATVLVACGTVKGLGQDLQDVSDTTEKAISPD